MKPIQLLLKSTLVFGFILCFVNANAQSLNIHERGETQLRLTDKEGPANNAVAGPASYQNVNDIEHNPIFATLEGKLNFLLSWSDSMNGDQLIHHIIGDYNLPTNELASLNAVHSEHIQNFVQNFEPRDQMEESLLAIFKRLKAEIE